MLAAINSAARGINRYPDGGCFVLRRRALAKKLNIDEDQQAYFSAMVQDEIICLAVKAFAAKGDDVIIAKPSFLIYEIASTLSGARLHQVPLKDFRYDLQAMKAKINARAPRSFLSETPDNPARNIYHPAPGRRFLAFCA